MRAVPGVLLLLVVLLTASCASAPRTIGDEMGKLRNAVTTVVADEERVSRMLEKVDEMEEAIVDLGTLVDEDRESLKALLSDYETPRPEMEAFVDEHTEQREAALRGIVGVHFEFKALALPDEWKKLAKAERKALTLMVQRSLAEAPLVGKGDDE